MLWFLLIYLLIGLGFGIVLKFLTVDSGLWSDVSWILFLIFVLIWPSLVVLRIKNFFKL